MWWQSNLIITTFQPFLRNQQFMQHNLSLVIGCFLTKCSLGVIVDYFPIVCVLMIQPKESHAHPKLPIQGCGGTGIPVDTGLEVEAGYTLDRWHRADTYLDKQPVTLKCTSIGNVGSNHPEEIYTGSGTSHRKRLLESWMPLILFFHYTGSSHINQLSTSIFQCVCCWS